MYNHNLHQQLNQILRHRQIDIAGADNLFYTRFIANVASIHSLFKDIYPNSNSSPESFERLLDLIVLGYLNRPVSLRQRDLEKQEEGQWFLSNKIVGMSLYVDRSAGNINSLVKNLPYLEQLGVNLLHLMPLFESPEGASDGGYAVSDFRKVNPAFGDIKGLRKLQSEMQSKGMFLMLDIVLNHTSDQHEWAKRARAGEKDYQDYYYLYDDRSMPDLFEKAMPEIFPESAPGNFTFVAELKKWVMTVFHRYQWDLNYRNEKVLFEMLDNIFFYANMGVDILRIDAPAFIWKEVGTSCQNLPQAHTLLRLIKLAVQVATPGMALLGEAIVAPREIMKYFGTGNYIAKECDFAYNATHMALQWDALATGDTRVMMAAQYEILQKPYGTSWITYTRCHDDIGLGYEDYMIRHAGYEPFQHRRFLMEYYSGVYPYSPAKGALFSVNPRTNDARISGTLASLCGLEKALEEKNEALINISRLKIIMMQAHSFFLGGIPMIFYGDEMGTLNDYSYLSDPGKNYDNRWMHRPKVEWPAGAELSFKTKVSSSIFNATKKLIEIRKKLIAIGDYKNITWLSSYNSQIAAYLRAFDGQKIYCLFNFKDQAGLLSWKAFREHGEDPAILYDHWSEKTIRAGSDTEALTISPYQFMIMEVI